MKRMTAALVLLAIAAGCAGTKRRAIVPGHQPTEEQEYLEGFADGYRGVRPMDPHRRDRQISSGAGSYSQGLRDGYVTGGKDEMQRRWNSSPRRSLHCSVLAQRCDDILAFTSTCNAQWRTASLVLRICIGAAGK